MTTMLKVTIQGEVTHTEQQRHSFPESVEAAHLSPTASLNIFQLISMVLCILC